MIINNPPKRNTSQKLKIISYLKSVKTHPTAERVYEEVKKDLPAISLATVYRNLNRLADKNKILKFTVNHETHFDGNISFHQHFVCRECGNIVDVFQKEISEYALNKVRSDGFEIDSVGIIYYGTCKNCLEVKKND